MPQLAKLVQITDLREVWRHEERDFSKWLSEEEHLKELSDAVGISIIIEERESSVGKFSADLYAIEEGTNRRIIIENQLEDTNHDHLGKIITYAAGKGASIVIWILKKIPTCSVLIFSGAVSPLIWALRYRSHESAPF